MIARLQVVILSQAGGAFPPVTIPGTNSVDLDHLGGEAGLISTEQAAAHLVGLAVHETADSGDRLWVIKCGILRDCDTSAWAQGQTLWAGVGGNLTGTQPGAKVARIRVGMVLEANAVTGALWVDVRVLPAIGDLTGVDVATIADLQMLQWRDDAGTLTLQNVQPGDPYTVAPLDASARIPDQHLRWSRFLMMGE